MDRGWTARPSSLLAEHLAPSRPALPLPQLAPLRDSAQDVAALDTRRRGGQLSAPSTPRLVVDVREFMSSLPSILHQSGFKLMPATIEVGDYVLSPDVCVERKAIPDLIGSLQSGRLYNQAEAMCRHYKIPILLIEFEREKNVSCRRSGTWAARSRLPARRAGCVCWFCTSRSSG